MTDYKTQAESKADQKILDDKKAAKLVVEPALVELPQNRIPEGSIDIRDLKPGYGPLEGSPKENDPTQLANPNNPISYVTRPVNPSNPANMPAMQSEKPASEVAKMPVPPEVLAARKKAEEEAEAKEKKEIEAAHKEAKK
jgi:hypothetical protein